MSRKVRKTQIYFLLRVSASPGFEHPVAHIPTQGAKALVSREHCFRQASLDGRVEVPQGGVCITPHRIERSALKLRAPLVHARRLHAGDSGFRARKVTPTDAIPHFFR